MWNKKKELLLLIVSSAFCFIILEAAIHFLGAYDSDEQFSIGNKYLLPYTLPFTSTEEYVAEFDNVTNSYAVPDVYLGWTIGSNSSSLEPEGYYQSNSIGVRSYKEFEPAKQEGVVRIAMFGDSFIHSYDVPMNETLAFYIENESSTATEVMNFGVGAYGIDQAYLRWKVQGQQYKPDIIIIGFQAENCKRNANIIRRLYFRGTKIPFSKPRFVLENDTLVLINYPTIPYHDVPDVVKDFENHPLAQYEYYYDPEDYKTSLLLRSKIIRYIVTLIDEYKNKKNDYLNYQEGSEIRELCYALLEQFYNEASVNATAYILHLPTVQDLSLKIEKQDFVYEDLLLQLKEDFTVIDPTDALLQAAEQNTIESLFVGHYSDRANEIVAETVVEGIE